MNERPDPSPEGRLIAEALRQLRPKTSTREAARRAGISEARWRQIASGYQMVSGQPVPVTAPAETIARMAQAVGVTPEQLEAVSREDAAAELRELLTGQPTAEEPEEDPYQMIREANALLARAEEIMRRQREAS